MKWELRIKSTEDSDELCLMFNTLSDAVEYISITEEHINDKVMYILENIDI